MTDPAPLPTDAKPNGLIEPTRHFESLYTDHVPADSDFVFADVDVDVIVEIVSDIRRNAIWKSAA